MRAPWYDIPMAQRSTFLVHVTSDDSVWIEVVATGEVVSVPDLALVGAEIERRSGREPGEDAGVER